MIIMKDHKTMNTQGKMKIYNTKHKKKFFCTCSIFHAILTLIKSRDLCNSVIKRIRHSFLQHWECHMVSGIWEE